MKRADGPVVLARHGVDPDLDAEGLIAALAGRGWAVAVEEEDAGPRATPGRRWQALATRPRTAPIAGFPRFPEHLRARERSEVEALARVLALALAQEEGR